MLVRLGTNRNDSPKPPYPHGFSMRGGIGGAEVMLYVECARTIPGSGNSVELKPDIDSALWRDPERLRELLRVLIETWGAETAAIRQHMSGPSYPAPDGVGTIADSWNEGWLYWQRDDVAKPAYYKPPGPASSSEPWLNGSLLVFDEWAPPRMVEGLSSDR
jgi:hypothetical protein